MDKFNTQYATRKLREDQIEETSMTGAGEATLPRWTGPKKKTKKNEIVKKVGDKYAVYPEKGGKRLGTHDSKAKANKQLAAIEISKAQKESKIPADWTDAPSIPNRPSKGGFQYKQLFEMKVSDLEYDYPEFVPVVEYVADYLGLDLKAVYEADIENASDDYFEIVNIPGEEGKSVFVEIARAGQGSKKVFHLNITTSSDTYSNVAKTTMKDSGINENETPWPEEIFSRHKDMKFVKQSESEKGVTYQIIDLENNDKPMRSIRFSSIETLEDYAQNLIKPQGGTQSTYLGENYSRFKKETKTRTNEQQLHTAMRLAEKKIREANRILEYTSQLRGELNETRMNKNTQKLMERITRGIAEAYGKMKKLK